MRFLVLSAIIYAHCHVRVSSLVKRTFSREKLSLKWGHMMARYIPKSELVLGHWNPSKTLSQQLSAIVFDLSVGKLISHLDGIDKPALEWFDAFISGISADNGESYESHVMNALTSTDAFLFEYERVTDQNPDVSIKFSHVVEPWVLASLLLNSKKTVFKEMQAAVQEVQLDNTVAAGDAFMIFKKGTTRWHPSRSDGSSDSTYQQLHLLVTNAALNLLGDNLSGREGEGGDSEGLEYVHSILEMMSFDVQATTGGFRAGDSVRPSQKFLEVLLKLGYEALADNNFTHHDIEEAENMGPASTGRDSRGEKGGERDGATEDKVQSEKGINPKSIIAGHIESYGEDMDEEEALQPSVMGVMQHRVAQDMLAYRTNACTTITALLLDFLNSPQAVAVEADMLGRIYGKESLRVAGSRSIPLESSTVNAALVIPPSLSVTTLPLNGVEEKREEEGKVLNPDSERDRDSDSSSVTVGSPTQAGSDSSSGNRDDDFDRSRGSNKVGSDDDRVGNAISNLFGSIIKTFRSDKGSEEGSEDTATSPQGDRVKSNIAVLDPPGGDLPPKDRRSERDSGYDDSEDRRPIDWGEEVPEGDLAAFFELGPNARIRYISQKEELGRKYIYLEGKSLTAEGSATTVVKQWVDYDVAMDFLKNGFGAQVGQRQDGQEGGGGGGDSTSSDKSASASQGEDIRARNKYIPALEVEEAEECSSNYSPGIGDKKVKGRAALVERAQMM